MSPRTIRIYLDYISPNAYLAWNQLPKLAEKYGFQIDAVPVLYAALLDASGTLGPGETPAKGNRHPRKLVSSSGKRSSIFEKANIALDPPNKR